jgi:hypothetical protein
MTAGGGYTTQTRKGRCHGRRELGHANRWQKRSVNLDVDEFAFVGEPYEMMGGDYTKRYLTKHEVGNAAVTALKSYYFCWKYRPLFSPIIEEKDKHLFQREETLFGYKKPVSVQRATDPDRVAKYAQRLVVPEPERFYRNGTGSPYCQLS